MMDRPDWYAFTTQPRHEKRVAEQLQSRSIEAFLPLIAAPSRWKDRQVVLERPVFPGYVFARIDLHQRRQVFCLPGIVRMLSFNGQPARIDDAEIEAVRTCLAGGNNPKPHPFLDIGERVRVKSGSLIGLEGIVLRHKNHCRIVFSITLIHQAVAVETDAILLEPIGALLRHPTHVQ